MNSFISERLVVLQTRGLSDGEINSALYRYGVNVDRTTVMRWRRGLRYPQARHASAVLAALDQLKGSERT